MFNFCVSVWMYVFVCVIKPEMEPSPGQGELRGWRERIMEYMWLERRTLQEDRTLR